MVKPTPVFIVILLLALVICGCRNYGGEDAGVSIHVDTVKTTLTISDVISMDTITTISIKSGDIEYFIDRFKDVILKEYDKFSILPSIYMSLAILANRGCTTSICNYPTNNYMNIHGNEWDIYFDKDIEYDKFDTAWASFRRFSILLREEFAYAIDSDNYDYNYWLELAFLKGLIDYENMATAKFLIVNYNLDKYDQN